MTNFDRKSHWENIYSTKSLEEVSWHQPIPTTSLQFFTKNNIPLDAKIIDIGGGDSFLVDNLLELGYTNLSVLDISAAAIERAKVRLNENASKVTWIVSDITQFKPEVSYDFWHDRAVFHFLTEETEIEQYRTLVADAVVSNGTLAVGTFSENGPLKCSGIEIKRYSIVELTTCFESNFEPVEKFQINHDTPFGTVQHFTFVRFKKK
ncbi:trans-aconitate 2-methyltransferase [Flavobacterium antarcticum]|uniref:class I SAM-dependent methyltransferase n=1 Tax=Flavobacterium antarcticum TaxID=271155 RepID=UPI0003B7840F|nr:class I SAM-dependent methyltransferase [Flavobacterium antarcticum]